MSASAFLLHILGTMLGIVALVVLLVAAFAVLWRVGKARGWVE
jgi:hypothetical protein